MSTDQAIENEIKEKGLTAPRVTPERIQEIIAQEYWGRASDLFRNTPAAGDSSMQCLTICVLVLKNGFTVTGESACASPENFDAEIGYKIARQNAVAKIWPLEGYVLKNSLGR